MKIIAFAVPALLLGVATPAATQTVADDVQCLVLSGVFAKSASQEAAKLVASRTLIFYLGRLDAGATSGAIKNQIQATKIDPKTASARMSSCAQRAEQAARTILPIGEAQGQKR